MEAERAKRADEALRGAKAEGLLIPIKLDGSFYDVTMKPFTGKGEGFPRFEARLSLVNKKKRSLGKYITREEAAVAVARGMRDALNGGELLAKRRCNRVFNWPESKPLPCDVGLSEEIGFRPASATASLSLL